MKSRPLKDEYNPYFDRYIKLVPEGDILSIMKEEGKKTSEFFQNISEEKSLSRYAEDKWSIRQIIGHLTDTERIFNYRALRFARNDKTDVKQFEENYYVAQANFDDQSLSELIHQLHIQRVGTFLLFQSFMDTMWLARGTAEGTEFSVRGIAYIIIGHVMHHVGVIKERYLK